MVNEIPGGVLTVRELGQALDRAHPEQVVTFTLTSRDFADLEPALRKGLGVSFAVGVDLGVTVGPVFRLVPATHHSTQAE